MHKIVNCLKKNNYKKCVHTLPKIFRQVTRNTLIFLFGLNKQICYSLISKQIKKRFFFRLLTLKAHAKIITDNVACLLCLLHILANIVDLCKYRGHDLVIGALRVNSVKKHCNNA